MYTMDFSIQPLREVASAVKVRSYRLAFSTQSAKSVRVKVYERVQALNAEMGGELELGDANQLKGGLLEAFGWVLPQY